ncbi:MAG: two-component regulator propeller domain-containing protein [Candidatus Acidiferrum sp.]
MFCLQPNGTLNYGKATRVLGSLWKFRFFAAGMLLACLSVTVFGQARHADTEVTLPIVDGTDLRFTQISFGQGPSHARISAIVQDNQGFLWFGTQDGLRRYDGYRTRVYRHDSANPNTVSGDFIFDLFRDHAGNIWIASNEYLDSYDPAAEVFTHYANAPFGAQVQHINEDRSGIIWLATNSGLVRLNPSTKAATLYQHIPGDNTTLASNELSSTFEEKDGTFWVATAESLDVFDRSAGRVTQHILLGGSFPLQVAGPIRLHEDRADVLWLTLPGGSGLAVVDRHAGALIRYFSADTKSENSLYSGVRTLLEDADGALWLGTQSGGLLKLDKERKSFVRYRNDPAEPGSLSADRVDALYEDPEGNIWVGTTGGGANRFSRRPLPFQRYRFERPSPAGQNLNTIWTVFEDRAGFLWIATLADLRRIDGKTGTSKSWRIAGGPGHAAFTFVISIAEDLAGHMWFGTYGGGLRRYDKRTGRFKAYRHDATESGSLPNDFVPAIIADRDGTVWIATGAGIAALDQKSGKFRTYRAGAEAKTSYRVMAEGSDGAIWLGTYESGVQRLDPATGQFTFYPHDPGKAASLSNNQVNALLADHSGTLWVGTSSGLNRFEAATRTFVAYTERDGLPNDNVNGIVEDERGDLWLTTNNGISRFDPRAKTFTNYTTADGLPTDEFFYGADSSFRSRIGEMYFSSRTALSTCFPSKIVDNPYVPPVVLTDFQLFGKPVAIGGNSTLKQSISVTKSLTLTYKQNVFGFEFSALSYASPQRNRYRYRLEGLENKWNETDSSRRFVTYTTLPPREYVFRVQGSNNHGVWNERGVSVRIRILPPWWGTWWFRAIAVASLVLSLWCVYYLRLQGVERRQAEIRALNEQLIRGQEEERMRIAGELHDGILQQLTSLSLQLATATLELPPDSEPKAEVREVEKKLIQVGTEIRQMSHELHPAALKDAGLPSALHSYCEEFTNVRGIPISYKADESVEELSPGAALCIYRVAQEALGNVAKHASAKQVEVRLTRSDNRVCLLVSDDGVGFNSDGSGKSGGLGLINMRERVRQLNGTFECHSEPGRGTKVKVEIPFRPAS